MQCPGSATVGDCKSLPAVTCCHPPHTIAKKTTIRATTYDSESSRSSAETGLIHNDNIAGIAVDHTDEDGWKKMQAEHIRRRNRVILFLLLASIIIFVIVDSLMSKHIPKAFCSLYHWVDLHPLSGAFVLTSVTFVATLAFIPGYILTVGCGVVFSMTLDLGAGIAVGSVVVFVGASLGSEIALEIGLLDPQYSWQWNRVRIAHPSRIYPILPHKALPISLLTYNFFSHEEEGISNFLPTPFITDHSVQCP